MIARTVARTIVLTHQRTFRANYDRNRTRRWPKQTSKNCDGLWMIDIKRNSTGTPKSILGVFKDVRA